MLKLKPFIKSLPAGVAILAATRGNSFQISLSNMANLANLSKMTALIM